MRYRIDTYSDIPPSRQLVSQVLDCLARGDIDPGAPLPSVRSMASECLVNPNTVLKAYRELEEVGAVQARNGSGVYVTASGPAIASGIRKKETLHAFRAAAEKAVNLGHGAADLLGELGKILEGESERGAPRSLKQGRTR